MFGGRHLAVVGVGKGGREDYEIPEDIIPRGDETVHMNIYLCSG